MDYLLGTRFQYKTVSRRSTDNGSHMGSGTWSESDNVFLCLVTWNNPED